MLMKVTHPCRCADSGALVNITEWHDEFCQQHALLDEHDRQQLRQCPHCGQYWRNDRHGAGKVLYAVQLAGAADWQAFDAGALIRARMLQNRGGYGDDACRVDACSSPVINGSVYCLDHLYASGARL
ncbi:MAG TPA: hypothetical protein VIN71_03830 [Pseudomonadales bacterium]